MGHGLDVYHDSPDRPPVQGLWLCQNGSQISFRGPFLGTGAGASVCQRGKSTYKLI